MGRLRTAPEFYTVCPHRSEHTFIQEEFVLKRNLFYLRLRSQYMPRNFRFKWWHIVLIRLRQVRRWSRCNPYTLSVGLHWYQEIVHSEGRSELSFVVNFTWTDFDWFILIFHVSAHTWRMLRWCWRCCVATIRWSWTGSRPVSSAKAAIVGRTVVFGLAVKIWTNMIGYIC